MIDITLNNFLLDRIEPLTKEEVQSILKKASVAVVDGNPYTYRLGQAIYNVLPDRVSYIINGTDQDMFHVKDEDLAITMLLNLTEKLR